MKVALVTGSWPPQPCGIGDYSDRLADALTAIGQEVERIDGHGSVTRLLEVAGRIAEADPDVVHVQYPSAGYGRSLLPSLLPFMFTKTTTVVTLHEFSIFRIYRLPWFMPFAYGANAVVLTSEVERQAFCRRLPWPSARLEVIGIGSNIPRGFAASRSAKSVCYFGLLMPSKGLEDFLSFAEALTLADSAWKILLIGAAPAGCEAYADAIITQARQLKIDVVLDQRPVDVAAVLSATSFAYLPGPGGITERRGSVLAALENGVQVVGPVGKGSPAWLRDCVVDARSPSEAVHALCAPDTRRQSVAAAVETQWSAIAERHLKLYTSVARHQTT